MKGSLTFAVAWLPTLGLFALAGGMTAIFNFLSRQNPLKTSVPEFIALSLLAGILYLIGVYCVERFSLGGFALGIILAAAIVFRLLLLPSAPSLSDDIYRYQWEGRVHRAGYNPYTVYPAMPSVARFQDPAHRLTTASTNPTPYPAIVEKVFSWVHTVPGYKRLFTALDLASVGVLLLLLARLKQPLHRVLAYAWNPTVIVAFAACGHHDSMAILALLLAELLVIIERPALSMAALTMSILCKYFPAILLPVFLKRWRWAYAGLFAVLAGLAYLPYLSAGTRVFKGLRDYAAGWESNDSLFRLIRHAGNSKPQADLVAGVLLLGLLALAFKKRMEPLQASPFLIAGLLLLSSNAFPWYFTWVIPFLCFSPSPALLLLSVTAVLGYFPVVAYAAGQAYRDSPFILALEYVPVYLLIATEVWRRQNSSRRNDGHAKPGATA